MMKKLFIMCRDKNLAGIEDADGGVQYIGIMQKGSLNDNHGKHHTKSC